jgi:gamma-glutamyltranspeptidase
LPAPERKFCQGGSAMDAAIAASTLGVGADEQRHGRRSVRYLLTNPQAYRINASGWAPGALPRSAFKAKGLTACRWMASTPSPFGCVAG